MWHGPGLAGEKPVSKLPDAKEYLTVRLEAPKEPPACSCIRKTVLAYSYSWHCDSRPLPRKIRKTCQQAASRNKSSCLPFCSFWGRMPDSGGFEEKIAVYVQAQYSYFLLKPAVNRNRIVKKCIDTM